MTDYSDIPAVTTLHGEAERTQQALDMLNAGGTMTNFTIAPPPASGGVPPPSGMMAVQIQVTEPLSAEMITALNDWLTTRLANIIDELATYDVGPPPPPPTAPPVNTVAPVVEQVGSNLTCTTGIWDGMPTSFTYQWNGGSNASTNSPTYVIALADVGNTINCTVSATNTIGTTQGPPSNDVVVTSPPAP